MTRDEGEPFGDYKRRLIEHWIDLTPKLIREHRPSIISMETLPAVGSGNFALATQAELGKAVMTTVTVIALQSSLMVVEVPASTVKKAVFGMASKPPKKPGQKRVKVSKVDMRNAVQAVYPILKDRKWEVDLLPDEIDAIAVALCTLGYKVGKT